MNRFLPISLLTAFAQLLFLSAKNAECFLFRWHSTFFLSAKDAKGAKVGWRGLFFIREGRQGREGWLARAVFYPRRTLRARRVFFLVFIRVLRGENISCFFFSQRREGREGVLLSVYSCTSRRKSFKSEIHKWKSSFADRKKPGFKKKPGFVIPQGLEPWTLSLKGRCSTC